MSTSWLNLGEAEIAHCLAVKRYASAASLAEDLSEFSSLLSGPPRPAAVLIPLLRKNGIWHVLFTHRNAGLTEHSGQVAFPGGRSDPNDHDAVYTALREAHEEIGLKPSDVRILGKLKEFLTITNYLVTPVVGVMPWPYPLTLATEEVSHAFTIPLEWLAEPSNREELLRTLPPPFSPIPVIYFRPYEGEILWGASARFILVLLQILEQNCSRESML